MADLAITEVEAMVTLLEVKATATLLQVKARATLSEVKAMVTSLDWVTNQAPVMADSAIMEVSNGDVVGG